MLNQTITIEQAIAYLNELIELDRPAIAALIANRVPCNDKLAHHPTCQVSSQHGGYHVGFLGVLNGLFGIDERGYGPITFIFEADPNSSFDRLAGVTRTEHKTEEDDESGS